MKLIDLIDFNNQTRFKFMYFIPQPESYWKGTNTSWWTSTYDRSLSSK